ncbi:hypothetical protein D3C80_1615500 [compost metagenome]
MLHHIDNFLGNIMILRFLSVLKYIDHGIYDPCPEPVINFCSGVQPQQLLQQRALGGMNLIQADARFLHDDEQIIQ